MTWSSRRRPGAPSIHPKRLDTAEGELRWKEVCNDGRWARYDGTLDGRYITGGELATRLRDAGVPEVGQDVYPPAV